MSNDKLLEWLKGKKDECDSNDGNLCGPEYFGDERLKDLVTIQNDGRKKAFQEIIDFIVNNQTEEV